MEQSNQHLGTERTGKLILTFLIALVLIIHTYRELNQGGKPQGIRLPEM